MTNPQFKTSPKFEDVLRLNREGLSLTEAAREVGVHPTTVSKWVRESGALVVRHKGGQPQKRIKRPCRQCGTEMEFRPSEDKHFCSRKCTNAWQREQVEARVCEGCGGKIELQPGAKTMFTYRKYCSDECRAKYGSKRQKDPTKWVAKVCQNETCGKTFEVRVSSQSYGKYCSNACAYKHTKTKQHIVVDDSTVLDSGWEALFYGLMAFEKTPCLRFDRTQGIEWAPGHWYAPDFYLPDLDTAVEIKGLEDTDDPERWSVYREQRGRLLVLDQRGLEGLLHASDRKAYLVKHCS